MKRGDGKGRTAGFVAPDGQTLGVDHEALGQAALAHNSTVPATARNLCLTEMKENCREGCTLATQSSPTQITGPFFETPQALII